MYIRSLHKLLHWS